MKTPGIRIHYRTTWTKGQARELEAIEQRNYNPPWNDRIESLGVVSGFIRSVVGWLVSIPISIVLYWGLLHYWQPQQKPTYFTVIQLANIREKPNLKSKIICKIKRGVILETEGYSEWRSVKTCGTVGYIHKLNLKNHGN